MLCDLVWPMRARTVVAIAASLLVCCRRERPSLIAAVALLPSELPVYRAVVADFERSSGLRV